MKRSLERQTEERLRQRAKVEVPAASVQEGLSLVEDCTDKLVELRDMAEVLPTAQSSSLKQMNHDAESGFILLENALDKIYRLNAAATASLQESKTSLEEMDPGVTVGLAPTIEEACDVKAEPDAGNEGSAKDSDAWWSDPELMSVRRRRLAKAKQDLLQNHSIESLHHNEIRAVVSRVKEISAVSYGFQTGFGIDTLSASRAQYV